jgi:hypothetical protein
MNCGKIHNKCSNVAELWTEFRKLRGTLERGH